MAGLLAVTALGGCLLVEAVFPGETRFVFSHETHVHEERLDCFSCHETAMMTDDPGMPEQESCAVCHDEIDEGQPEERRVESLFVDGAFQAARMAALDGEVLFSHLQHVTAEDSCGDCHTNIERNDAVGPEQAVPMDDCMECHARQRAPNECADCHAVITEDWEPDNHHQNWELVHGMVSRAAGEAAVENCSLCHREAGCVECHLEVPPRDHTNYFRRRGHGVISMMDRARCDACHRSDSCQRCHAEALPVSHTGMFGGTKSLHCLGCHFPLKSEAGCVTCHQATPSHLSTPKPPDHTPTMVCRQCHGLSAALPHVDKGDDCNQCHP